MSMTIATNIRLPEDLLKALKYKAIEEKKSMNQLICEAIEISLADVPRSQGREKDSFEDLSGGHQIRENLQKAGERVKCKSEFC